MSSPAPTTVTCSDLTFTWPDGGSAFTGLNAGFPTGTTGLIGGNGTGKTTLLRLLAGHLRPTAGSISMPAAPAYLPQTITTRVHVRVAEALGIDAKLRALAAIEAGEATEEHWDTLGQDWDVEQRAHALLSGLGLEGIGLHRRVEELSGGQTVLLHLAALMLARPQVLLLDEPTNNLDRQARHRLREAVRGWRHGTLIVVSHDRELLDDLDRIAELRAGEITFYGGGFSSYEQAVATQQAAAERDLRAAEADERRQQRELAETQVKLSRRKRQGAKAADNMPKILAGARQRAAQESAGKLTGVQQERLQAARDKRRDAQQAVRSDERLRLELPATRVPAGRDVARVSEVVLPHSGARVDLEVHGPQRIALLGGNGTGKTTLLRVLEGTVSPLEGQVAVPVTARLMPQRLDVLDPGLSVAGNLARAAPGLEHNEVRAHLARLLFTGDRAQQQAGTLSGGQALRASLAAVLLAEPAPQLLMLDEPTNNLDLDATAQLASALRSFEGALIVAGHDVEFLREIEPTRWLLLTDTLTEITEQEAEEI
ncbi:ABC-F family ATP-binding cassette domain-containing protein [Saccharopolyspora dendranthemae]|uniref:ATPase subunit of ABC transporter with duplicated ATPase domains n=1 Tax=Saccharopolyspora dendranthemae TaxID=1181886 RepID=A0A561U953_9PSEU|nr:ABC-F family ATP-binding cassette domain-containing protein [Saccharopolyspora dendranthemae]TWF95891.1 ATPase subunit of ABC transporter with duplicated ATPase domains [Saccharopolyspora dendranthemae]